MKQVITHVHLPSKLPLLAIAGGLSVAGLMVVQVVLGGAAVTTLADGSNDDFPGGSAGGGTHWVSPNSHVTIERSLIS